MFKGNCCGIFLLLAIPVMFGASLLKLVKFGFAFSQTELIILLTGMIVAFAVSIFAIKFLMDISREMILKHSATTELYWIIVVSTFGCKIRKDVKEYGEIYIPFIMYLYPLPKQLKLLFQLCEPTRFRCCSLWNAFFKAKFHQFIKYGL